MWNQLFLFLLGAVYASSMEQQVSVEVFPPACQPVKQLQPATKATQRWDLQTPKTVFSFPKNFSTVNYCSRFPFLSFHHAFISFLTPGLSCLPTKIALGKGNCWAAKLPATANPIPDKSTSNIPTGFEPDNWAKQFSLCHEKVSVKQRSGRRWGFGQLGSGSKKRGRERILN